MSLNFLVFQKVFQDLLKMYSKYPFKNSYLLFFLFIGFIDNIF